MKWTPLPIELGDRSVNITLPQKWSASPNAKTPEVIGKGGTLSGGQVSGDLPCRGAGNPLAFPSFPKRWGGYALRRIVN